MKHLLTVSMLLFGMDVGAGEFASEGGELRFRAHYEGEPIAGEFNRFTTRLVLPSPTEAEGELHVRVDTASIDFASDDLREGAVSEEWFFVLRFPDAVFHSDDIRETGVKRYVARGSLTIKGVERPVSVPFSLDESGPSPVIEGQLTLQRTDFDIGTGDWSDGATIGLEVGVTFHVPLQTVE